MTDLIKFVGTALRTIVFRASRQPLCAQHPQGRGFGTYPRAAWWCSSGLISRDSSGTCPKEGAKAALVQPLGTKGLMQPKVAEGVTHTVMQEPMRAGSCRPQVVCCTAGIAGLALGAQQAGTLQSQGYHVMLVVAMETVVSHGKHASIVPVPPRAERSRHCQGAGTWVTGCPVPGARAVLQSAVLLSPHVQRLPAPYHLSLWVSRTYVLPNDVQSDRKRVKLNPVPAACSLWCFA